MVEMDENVTLAAQLEEEKDGRSVILINVCLSITLYGSL
jgi:hypothetical protein